MTTFFMFGRYSSEAMKEDSAMKKDDKEVAVGLRKLNPHDEVKSLNSCIAAYFKGATGSLPLKEEESFILSALTIYFKGYAQ